MKTNWYVATLIIRSRVEGDNSSARPCDEQIRLIRAQDEEIAYQKALKLGKAEEQSYQNGEGETVYWEFVGLANLEELTESIQDGTEIRSRLFDSSNPSSLVRPKDQLSVYLGRSNNEQTVQASSVAS